MVPQWYRRQAAAAEVIEALDHLENAVRTHPFEVGGQMVEALRAAGVAPPQWPPVKKLGKRAGMADEIDDEIPF